MVGFAELPFDVAGILGQDGFFDRFAVTLDQTRGLILLNRSLLALLLAPNRQLGHASQPRVGNLFLRPGITLVLRV